MVPPRAFETFDDDEAMAIRAASLALEALHGGFCAGEPVRVILPGGRSTVRACSALAEGLKKALPLATSIQWYWADDFCGVSNHTNPTREALLDKLGVPSHAIYEWPVGMDPTVAAKEASAAFNSLAPLSNGALFTFGFLGLGTDGHTAAIFDDQQDTSSGLVHSVQDPEGRWRIGLTRTGLRRVQRIVGIVSGNDKLSATAALVGGSAIASTVTAASDTYWLIHNHCNE